MNSRQLVSNGGVEAGDVIQREDAGEREAHRDGERDVGPTGGVHKQNVGICNVGAVCLMGKRRPAEEISGNYFDICRRFDPPPVHMSTFPWATH